MKLFHLAKDGGVESTVWGFWLVEIKSLFSVAVLKFVGASRDAYHTHAFDSISWLLKGELEENVLVTPQVGYTKQYRPSLRPIITRRSTFHKVDSFGTTYVLTFRGPWVSKWHEYLPSASRFRTLTHGRKEV